MKTLVPTIYKDFRCIGSVCQDNCCIGWEIDIDETTADFYRSVSGAFGDRLQRQIDWENGCFILGEGERCPFLNKNNLCDIIIELGEEHLCHICDRHPRFRNILADRVEMGIGLCCEEEVRQLLAFEEKMTLVPGPDVDEEPAEVNPDLAEGCTRVRDLAFSVIQDRSLPLRERMLQLIAAADELYLCQDGTGEGQSAFCTKYEKGESIAHLPLENVDKSAVWQDIAGIFLSLERLDESWTALLEKLPDPADENDLPEIPAEQMVWYFLYRHMMAAAEDCDTAGRLMFAAVSFLLIRRMVQQGGDLPDILRRYCKEIEYSTDNMDALLDALAMEDCFAPAVVAALI